MNCYEIPNAWRRIDHGIGRSYVRAGLPIRALAAKRTDR